VISRVMAHWTFEFMAFYDLFLGVLVISYVLLIITELLIFISMFWSIFLGTCSSVICYEFIINGCSITVAFTITIILSYAGLCLVVVYLIRCYVLLCYVMSSGIIINVSMFFVIVSAC